MKVYRHETLEVVVKHKGVGEYEIDFSDIKTVSVSLSFDFNDGNWIEIVEPIFTTEDGFKFYSHSKDVNIHLLLPKGSWERKVINSGQIIRGSYTPSKQWKVFASKEALEEYERFNKPKYSYNDVVSCMNYLTENSKKIILSNIINLNK